MIAFHVWTWPLTSARPSRPSVALLRSCTVSAWQFPQRNCGPRPASGLNKWQPLCGRLLSLRRQVPTIAAYFDSISTSNYFVGVLNAVLMCPPCWGCLLCRPCLLGSRVGRSDWSSHSSFLIPPVLSPSFSPFWSAILCPASLGLPFSCPRPCLPACHPARLGCCVRLFALVLLLSPSLSPIWSEMLRPPLALVIYSLDWDLVCFSLLSSLVSQFVSHPPVQDAVAASSLVCLLFLTCCSLAFLVLPTILSPLCTDMPCSLAGHAFRPFLHGPVHARARDAQEVRLHGDFSKLSHDGPTPSEPPPSDGKRQKPDRDDGRNYHVAVPGWFRFITFKTSGILTKEIFLNRPCRSGSSFTRWPRHCSNSCSSLSRRRLWPMWGQEVVATKDS